MEGKEEDGNWMEGYRHFLQVIRLLRGHELWADPQCRRGVADATPAKLLFDEIATQPLKYHVGN